MAKYILIDPITGEQLTLSKARLTRNLWLNCILLEDDMHIGIITYRDLVAFSRWCASEVLRNLNTEPDQRMTHALALVDRWLEDQQSVSNEELEAAAWAVRLVTDAADAAWRAAENAYAVGISFETQAQWLVEHLQSGK